MKVIVRTETAGVFYGELVGEADRRVTLAGSRRLWYWAGAASLSELAVEGTSSPKACKFPVAIEGQHVVFNVIEVIEVTERASKSIEEVKPWSGRQ